MQRKLLLHMYVLISVPCVFVVYRYFQVMYIIIIFSIEIQNLTEFYIKIIHIKNFTNFCFFLF